MTRTLHAGAAWDGHTASAGEVCPSQAVTIRPCAGSPPRALPPIPAGAWGHAVFLAGGRRAARAGRRRSGPVPLSFATVPRVRTANSASLVRHFRLLPLSPTAPLLPVFVNQGF